jgi:hypothetical protein
MRSGYALIGSRRRPMRRPVHPCGKFRCGIAEGFGKLCFRQAHCVHEVGLFEMRLHEVGPLEMHSPKNGAFEMRAPEVGT